MLFKLRKIKSLSHFSISHLKKVIKIHLESKRISETIFQSRVKNLEHFLVVADTAWEGIAKLWSDIYWLLFFQC